MVKNKVKNIVVIVLGFIVALHIVNYFNDLKSVKTEKKEDTLLTEDVLLDDKVVETEHVYNNIPQDVSANLHNIKALTRVNELRGNLSITEFNEYGDIIYAREEQQEEVVKDIKGIEQKGHCEVS